MNPRIFNARPESFDPEDMNVVVRRLGDSGWLTKDSFVNKTGMLIHYSEKGWQRMRQFNDFLKSFPPHFFDQPGNQNPVDVAKLVLGAEKLVPELATPPLSEREYCALLALALAFKSNDLGKDAPPSSGRRE